MDENPPTHQARPAPTGLNLSRPVIAAILYLAALALPFTLLVGLVLSYIWRRDRDTLDWELSHFTYLIRTFWIGLLTFTGALIATFGAIIAVYANDSAAGDIPDTLLTFGVFAVAAAWVALIGWFCVRSILSIVRSSKSEPMPNPKTWLF